MLLTYAWILVILGGLIFGALQLNLVRVRGKTRQTWTLIAVPIVVVGLLGAYANIEFLSPLKDGFELGGTTVPASVATPSASVGVQGACPPGNNVEDTTVTLSSVNKFTTVATGGTHRYRVNGNPATTLANAGTFTASPGDTIEVLWMNGSETDSGYYADSESFKVPCAGTHTQSRDLYQNGTVTIEVYNEEGNLIDGTTNETLANGDVVTLEAKLKGQYQRGVPFGGILVAEYPQSQIDDVIVDFGGSLVGRPTFYRTQNGTWTTKTYTVPAILGNDILNGKITLDVDDTVNPSADAVNNVTLTFYPYGYYVDEKQGGAYAGPSAEDEEGTQTKKYSVLEGLTWN